MPTINGIKYRPIRFDRLQKLVDHLRSGELIHKFDFSVLNFNPDGWDGVYNTVVFKGREVKNCGKLGCAMGELPAVFPRHFYFNEEGCLCSADGSSYPVKDFFGLSYDGQHHLFEPGSQCEELSKTIPKTAGVKRVTNHIERFIQQMKKNPMPQMMQLAQ
jgi:hypothetical protein